MGLATSMSGVEAASVSDLYRKNYDKKAAMRRMRTMGASADPKVVRRMLANARGVDEKHYKAMLKAYNEANDPTSFSSAMSNITRAAFLSGRMPVGKEAARGAFLPLLIKGTGKRGML